MVDNKYVVIQNKRKQSSALIKILTSHQFTSNKKKQSASTENSWLPNSRGVAVIKPHTWHK
jgi:hypothetical protein